MTRIFVWSAIVLLLTVPARTQPVETRPQFEVADVHVSPRGAFPQLSGGMMGGGRYELRGATMVDLIRIAWGVAADRVFGGPSWLETDRFEVIAKAAPATPSGAVPLMLQKLLADRFGLLVHADMKPLPEFVLTAGRRPQLKATDGSGEPGCESKQNIQASPGAEQSVTLACHKVTMADFAARIAGLPGVYIAHPVVDQTGLNGAWDFNFTWTSRPGVAAGVTFVDAVNKRLGLKLEQQNVPMPVIVVDKVDETPTPNAPGVTQSLPPAPTQFEVAVVKPSAPDETTGGGFLPGDRVDLRAIPLRQLIVAAWGVSNDSIVDAPKWMSVKRFDINASASASAKSESAVGLPVNMDSMRSMLRALIVDRFKLAFHYEDRAIPVYGLVMTKSLLKKADPANRSGCNQGGGSPDASTAPIFTYTCRSTTMAQLAVKLRQIIGSDEIDHPVVNTTGLEGAWDFEFTWTPASSLQAAGGRVGNAGPASPGGPAPSDPTGGLSLLEALNKQLGLKLEPEKLPMSVFVIDHVDEKPADN
jgi:uncharacterized protein (TIGR03435 family)